MTPLDWIIREMIKEQGPLPIDRFMEVCLSHPQHGYYMQRDPFGREGDFTTAPEISQVFGELIGIWVSQVWQLMGSPAEFSLIELGPGRGTLMADIWRTVAKTPGLQQAASIQLVEMSPALRKLQSATLGAHATWHNSIESLPKSPMIVIANEFFDALSIRQFELKDGALFERCVTLSELELSITLRPTGKTPQAGADRVFETSPARSNVAKKLAEHICQTRGAALVIDYGYRKSASGDTLQAVKRHSFCSFLDTPGEADITAHVDFEQLLAAFERGGAKALPLLTQAQFLNAMGLSLRTQHLLNKLPEEQRESFLKASLRLVETTQMGQIFKVAAMVSPDLQVPYPFEQT
jgi:NADH dehydrogenase [ubiquinone] 1 alpha subcomplex assembly factor 7